MPGAMIKLDFAVTDNTIPKLRKDPILTNGSLALLDLSSPFITPPASIPLSTTVAAVPNVAWEEAKELLGAGDISTLAFDSYNNLTSVKGKVEITAKKGIHGIVTQTAQSAITDSSYLYLPSLIRDYIAANPTHKFYVSSWRRLTRLAITDTGMSATAMAIHHQTASKYQMSEMTNGVNNLPAVANKREALAVDLNPQIRNMATNGLTGIIDDTTVAKQAQANSVMMVGRSAPSYGSFLNKHPSLITYRVYIEDLTVSGRTYAQVDAIDKAWFDQAFAVGGTFYGDTYTAPATIA